MNFTDMKQNWDNQEQLNLTIDDETLSFHIQKELQKLTKSENRFLIGAAITTPLATAFAGLCLYLIMTGGITFFSESLFLPLIGLVIFPLYVADVSIFIIINHFLQKRKRSRFEKSLKGFISSSRSQIRNRIFLLQIFPMIYVVAILLTFVGLIMSPEINEITDQPLTMTLVITLPDVCLLSFLFFWSRKKITRQYRPQLNELKTVSQNLNNE